MSDGEQHIKYDEIEDAARQINGWLSLTGDAEKMRQKILVAISQVPDTGTAISERITMAVALIGALSRMRNPDIQVATVRACGRASTEKEREETLRTAKDICARLERTK